jgi:hypothetical protein
MTVHQWAGNFSSRAEARGTETANSDGLTISSNAAANTKGAFSSAGSATFDYNAITINLSDSNVATDYVVDIAVGSSTTLNSIIVPNLRLPSLKAIGYGNVSITLPISIRSGATIYARCADALGNSSCEVIVIGHSNGLGGVPGFSRCIALYTPSSSRGIAVDAGGTANTKGSWTEITASTSNRIAGMFAIVGPNNDVARVSARHLLDIGVGPSGSEVDVVEDLLLVQETTDDCPMPTALGPWSCDIPSGSRIAARLQSSTNTAGDRTIDLAVYGLVP